LSRIVSEELKRRFGLVDPQSTSVEIVQYRAIYAFGDVEKPGEYPFRPGLTVQEAISLAGGLFRPQAAALAGLTRDLTVARGELRSLENEKIELQASKARLEAEIANQPSFKYPAKFVSENKTGSAQVAMRVEQNIFDTHADTLKTKIENLLKSKDLLDKEIFNLKQKDDNFATQLKLAAEDRDNVRALAGKGLTVTSRQLNVEQSVAQLESLRLDINLSRVRAEQDRARIDRDILDLKNQRRVENLVELKKVDARLREIDDKARTTEQVAASTEGQAAISSMNEQTRTERAPEISITRNSDGRKTVISADYMTDVQPGDLISVRRSRPSLGYRTESLSE
jgi:hypothetical protein